MSCKLFVANFPYSTTNEELNTLFGPHGQVLSVKIATDRETGRSRGFGFVEMGSEQEADNARVQAALALYVRRIVREIGAGNCAWPATAETLRARSRDGTTKLAIPTSEVLLAAEKGFVVAG